MQFLKNLALPDIFARPVVLKVAGKEKVSTRHGFVCTMLFLAFIMFMMYYTSREMFQRKDPKVNTYDTFEEDPASMILSPDVFPFAFGLAAPTQLGAYYYIDKTVYHLEVNQSTFKYVKLDDGSVTERIEFVPLDIEPCSPEYFGELEHSFATISLNMLYCIKRKQTYLDQILLQGTEDSLLYKGLYAAIKPCKNSSSSSVVCAPQEHITEMLSGGWATLIYPDLAVNSENFDNPGLRFRKSYYTMVTPNTYKSTFVKLGHLEVLTDAGRLFQDIRIQNYLKVNSVEDFLDLTGRSDGYVYTLVMELDQLQTHYTRSYIKFQDILVQIQGIATTTILCVIILISPYSHIKMNESFINNIFDVKIPKRTEKGLKSKGFKKTQTKITKSNTNQKYYPAPLKNQKSPDSSNMEMQMKSYEDKDQQQGILFEEPRSAPLSGDARHELLFSIEDESNTITTPKNLINRKQMVSNMNILAGNNQHKREVKGPKLKIKYADQSDQPALPFGIQSPQNFKIQKALSGFDTKNLAIITKVDEIELTVKKTAQCTEKEERDEETGIRIEVGESPLFNVVTPKSSIQHHTVITKDRNSEIEQREQANKESIPIHTIHGIRESNVDHNALKEEEEEEEEEKYEVTKINITFWEYVRSFFRKSNSLDEKLAILRQGIHSIEERLDVLNIMKKFREIDKLKALLLEDDQLLLFNGIPKAEIWSRNNSDLTIREPSMKLLKDPKFLEMNIDLDKMMISYKNINDKEEKSKVDRQLLRVYDHILKIRSK